MVHVELPAIEIAASPERVREVLLDFSKMPEWHKGHFRSITIPSGKSGRDLVEGDKLEVILDHGKDGIKFSPAVLENSATRLRWIGRLPGVFSGDHVFEFHTSPASPHSTTFVQCEDFSGLLSFTMKPEKKSGVMNQEGFQKFNEDLKAKCEAQKVE